MEWADFVHLVRTSEQDSAENSGAYRRSVAAFAALGYAWVLGCFVLALGLVAWAVQQLLFGRFRLGLLLMLLAAGSVMRKNPLPVLIPCHRVFAAGNKIGGYSKGLGWKRRLLELEGLSC